MADPLVRVADTIYERATGRMVAMHTRGSWYEPKNEPFSRHSDRTVVEWSVAQTGRIAAYDALPIVPAVHPLTAALGARTGKTRRGDAKPRR